MVTTRQSALKKEVSHPSEGKAGTKPAKEQQGSRQAASAHRVGELMEGI